MIGHVIIEGDLTTIEYDDEFGDDHEFIGWEPALIPEGEDDPGEIRRIIVIDCANGVIVYDTNNVGFV